MCNCIKLNCENELEDIFRCKKHHGVCLWGKCRKKATTSMFCRLHFLAKEANYGLNDTDPENIAENKQPGGDFYEWGVRRLRDFALYFIDESGL